LFTLPRALFIPTWSHSAEPSGASFGPPTPTQAATCPARTTAGARAVKVPEIPSGPFVPTRPA